MALNKDRIRERLTYTRQQLATLHELSRDPEQRTQRMRDPLSFSGIVRHLQTSVEAMIDIAFHLCAKLYSREPQSAVDAFEILASRGALPPEFVPKAVQMVRFRNLVVHGYLNVDHTLVENILKQDLADFAEWEDIVVRLVTHEDVD